MQEVKQEDYLNLKRYENLTLSLEEARKLSRKEFLETLENEFIQRLAVLMGEKEARKKLEGLIEDDALRICLVATYGVDKFIAAADVVANQEPDLDKAMKLVELELSK